MLGYQLIADTTVSGSAVTSVDFTGLNITKDDDYMFLSEMYNTSGTASYPQLWINGNYTETNYYTQWIGASNTTVNSGRGNQANFTEIIAGTRSLFVSKIKLTNSGYWVAQHTENRKSGSSTMSLASAYSTSTFTSTSVTSLRMGAGANEIGIGSRFQLYKCIAEKVADITVGTATTSVDITGLSIDKTSEYMLVSDILNAGTGCDYYLYANANTTATNYYNQSISANSSTITPVRVNNATITNVATSAKNCVITNIKLTNNGYFATQSTATATYGGASVYLLNKYETSTFTATSITSLTITSATATQIAVGSRFQLYKLK